MNFTNTNVTKDQNKNKNTNINKDAIPLKCVLLGASEAGKTSIVRQYTANKFDYTSQPTIGASFTAKIVQISKCKIKAEIWDTAGQERFNSLIPLYYRNSNIAFIVYDITSQESYNKAQNWIKTIRRELIEYPIFVLIGNKCDLDDHRNVDTEDAMKYAKDNDIIFTEASAKTGQNIETVFNIAYERAYQKYIAMYSNNHNDDHNNQQNQKKSKDIINIEQQSTGNYISFCWGYVPYYQSIEYLWYGDSNKDKNNNNNKDIIDPNL